MNKPKLKKQEASYDWHEIADYIKDKYKRDVRDWAGRWTDRGHKEDAPYQDFWHWLLDRYDVRRGAYFTVDLPSYPGFKDFTPGLEPWTEEILTLLDKEFPVAKGQLRCWADW